MVKFIGLFWKYYKNSVSTVVIAGYLQKKSIFIKWSWVLSSLFKNL